MKMPGCAVWIIKIFTLGSVTKRRRICYEKKKLRFRSTPVGSNGGLDAFGLRRGIGYGIRYVRGCIRKDRLSIRRGILKYACRHKSDVSFEF